MLVWHRTYWVYVNALEWEEWPQEDSYTRQQNQVTISILFKVFPEKKGAQECSEKQLKIMDVSEANQTTPNSVNYIYNKCKKQRASREWLQAILAQLVYREWLQAIASTIRLKIQRKWKMCNIIQSVLW